MTNQLEYSLEWVLQEAFGSPGKNHYAHALARSRMDPPSEPAINMVLQLTKEQGDLWLDVLERMAIQNYQMCFEVCRNH